MVADGAHILLSMALVLLLLRAREPEPYFVAVLTASIPDVDKFVFAPLVEMGYVEGAVWVHRGITHSILFGVLLVAVFSVVGPWRAAVIGVVSHLSLDFLTGGVRLLVPLDSGLYGLNLSWLLANVAAMVAAVVILFAGVVRREFGERIRSMLWRTRRSLHDHRG